MSKRPAEEDFDPVVVDLGNLDREWQAQPRFMKRACLRVAEAKRAVAVHKTKVKVFEAEKRSHVRKHYDEYGFDKGPTKDEVNDTVTTQPGWAKLQAALADLEEEVDNLEAEVSALSHKKAALENSVILWCRDYNSEPRVPREHDQAARDKLQQVTSVKRYGGHRGTSEAAYDD